MTTPSPDELRIMANRCDREERVLMNFKTAQGTRETLSAAATDLRSAAKALAAAEQREAELRAEIERLRDALGELCSCQFRWDVCSSCAALSVSISEGTPE